MNTNTCQGGIVSTTTRERQKLKKDYTFGYFYFIAVLVGTANTYIHKHYLGTTLRGAYSCNTCSTTYERLVYQCHVKYMSMPKKVVQLSKF